MLDVVKCTYYGSKQLTCGHYSSVVSLFDNKAHPLMPPMKENFIAHRFPAKSHSLFRGIHGRGATNNWRNQ